MKNIIRNTILFLPIIFLIYYQYLKNINYHLSFLVSIMHYIGTCTLPYFGSKQMRSNDHVWEQPHEKSYVIMMKYTTTLLFVLCTLYFVLWACPFPAVNCDALARINLGSRSRHFFLWSVNYSFNSILN